MIVTKSSRVSISPGIDESKICKIESCVKSFVEEIDSEISYKTNLINERIKITIKSKIVSGYYDDIDEVTTILNPTVDWGDPVPSEVRAVIIKAVRDKLSPDIINVIRPSEFVDEFIMFNIYFAEKSAIMPFPGSEVDEDGVEF